MKKALLVLIILVVGFSFKSIAQRHLPEYNSISMGVGIMFPCIEGDKLPFFSKNGNRIGYSLMSEFRYYLSPNVGVGVQYDYLNASKLSDKMHVHTINPTITLRHLFSDRKESVFFSLGVGYLNYQERIYSINSKYGIRNSKGYCDLLFGLGYEFTIASQIGGTLKINVITTDWFANPNARLFNIDGYDDGVNHSFFKNDITFINLSFALLFGK